MTFWMLTQAGAGGDVPSNATAADVSQQQLQDERAHTHRLIGIAACCVFALGVATWLLLRWYNGDPWWPRDAWTGLCNFWTYHRRRFFTHRYRRRGRRAPERRKPDVEGAAGGAAWPLEVVEGRGPSVSTELGRPPSAATTRADDDSKATSKVRSKSAELQPSIS